MNVDALRSVLYRCHAQDLSPFCVAFRESSSPEDDANDDYRVIYEASFEPAALDKARIEFWITDSGHVAIGIETYERIARRLGLKAVRHGFAVGGDAVWYAPTHDQQPVAPYRNAGGDVGADGRGYDDDTLKA